MAYMSGIVGLIEGNWCLDKYMNLKFIGTCCASSMRKTYVKLMKESLL